MSWQRARGQALVEFALVFPVFMILVFGLIDVGRFVLGTNSANEAAREAARANAVMSWTDFCPTDPDRESCIRRIVKAHFENGTVPPPGGDWVYRCVDAGGAARGSLAACRNGDVLEVAFTDRTFRMLTPLIAQFAPNPVIVGRATVAFNNWS
jgi:hypothetical protein